ncbi:MAG: ATP-binding protein [Gallionella sp.]
MKLGLKAKLIGPWLIFILLLGIGFFSFRIYGNRLEADTYNHTTLHQQAISISKELLLQSQHRWIYLLEHMVDPAAPAKVRIEESEAESLRLLNQLDQLGFKTDNQLVPHDRHSDDVVKDNLILARTGVSDLYIQFVDAVDAGDAIGQKKFLRLIARKMRLIQAAEEDLMQYHLITQRVAHDAARNALDQAVLTLTLSVVALLVILIALTVYQVVEIVGPLKRLTDVVTTVDLDHAQLVDIAETDRHDEIGQLTNAFVVIMRRMRQYIDELMSRQGELLKQMGAIAHVGGWELDLATMKLRWTDEVYRIHEVDPNVSPALADGIKFYEPEARPVIQAAIEKAVADGTPWDLELPFITAKGKHLWVRALGSATLVDGKATRLMGAFQDITESKKASEKILQANADLEGFSYSISHDLRTPLRAIDGFSRMLLEDYADKLDGEGQRLLNVVRSNTERMSRLIDDILHFSRAGRTEMTLSSIDMGGLVQQVAEELIASGHVAPGVVTIETLPKVFGDRALLHQAIENLLTNAIKFSAKVQTPRVVVGTLAQHGNTVFYVRDNGVGFDMQYAGKLFGVFQRLHGINEYEGTGIGLAIAKRIVNRHGGRIWAESELGKGATFFFTIPTREENHE